MNKIRHFCFIITDINKSVKFYKQFGFTVHKRRRIKGSYISALWGREEGDMDLTYIKMRIDEEPTMLELIQFHNPKVPYTFNQSHISLTVDNLLNLYNSLSRQGVSFLCPPISASDNNVSVCFCKDPNGNLIELVEEK